MGMNALKKISSAKMDISFEQAKKEATDLWTVIGVADDVRTGQSDSGPWVAVRGNFEATRLSDGETFVSSELFLPNVISELFAKRVAESPGIRFAFVVGAKPSKTPIGYEYTIRSMVEETPSEALADLRALVAGVQGDTPKAIGSSKKEAVKA